MAERYLAAPWPEPVLPASSGDVSLPASGQVAVVSYAAVPYQRHVLMGLAWSYDADPGSGNLTVESPSGTVLFSEDITSKGPGNYDWRKGLKGAKGQALQVTLLAGGSNVKGKVNVKGHRTE